MTLPVVAIVGRPNVGKSTLFNRLIRSQKSVVHNRPGVTRDRIYEEAELLERQCLIIDTGGLEPKPDTDLLVAMRLQVLIALEEADVIIFVVDGRGGYTPADAEVADLLRRTQKPVVLAVNKIDGPKHEELSAEFWQIGVKTLFTISSEHGRGIYEMLEAVEECLPPESSFDAAEAEEDGVLEEGIDPHMPNEIRIAVIGRPNIGKSTLVNRLVGEDRHVVHDAPGTTMDPVDSRLEIDGKKYLLVDTAGIRKKNKISENLERWVSIRAIRAIERCHVSLLMVDGTVGVQEQDAKLARLVIDRGRALIVLFNKWDLTKDLEDVNARVMEDKRERRLPHATWAPHLFISAQTGKGVHRIIPMVNKCFTEFNRRISTSRFNRFLQSAVDAHSVPQRFHHPVRLYYGAQSRIRPPTFVLFSNTPEGVKRDYIRYLSRRLREDFGFEGSPIRIHVRKRRKLGEPGGQE